MVRAERMPIAMVNHRTIQSLMDYYFGNGIGIAMENHRTVLTLTIYSFGSDSDSG